MVDQKVISFDSAKQPHVFKQKEKKIASIKGAFAASRATSGSKSLVDTVSDKTKRNRRKRKKK